ncbi:MAG: AAA family ATPase [Clostridia bacterium]|nr:AAA family ATPase [Clostridia bacterium]
MLRYLFTNDLRISNLDASIQTAARLVNAGKVPSATEDKSANNNINTLAFYFNLRKGRNSSVAAEKGYIRQVVLNFIKKFQFPNPRTKESYNNSLEDGIVFAPMRTIIKILYIAFINDGKMAHLTRDEISEFLFFNTEIATKRQPDLLSLYVQIKDFRRTGRKPSTIVPEREREWKQSDRQLREMCKVLKWAGCVKETDDGKFYIDHDSLSEKERAELFSILTYNEYWNPRTEDYEKYMDFIANEELENERKDEYEDILMRNVIGMHITLKNDALSPDNSHVCIGWSRLGDLSEIADKDSLINLYTEKFPEKNNRVRGQDVGQIWSFLDRLKIGDYVVYGDGSVAHIGQIVSDYYYDTTNQNQDPDYTNNKKVNWLKDVAYRDLPKDLHKAFYATRSIFSLNEYKSVILDLLNNRAVDIDDQEETVTTEIVEGSEMINRKPRVNKTHPLNSILYGAPGTGKTYSTAEYALAIIENREVDTAQKSAEERAAVMDHYKELVMNGQVVFTTFHQSYGYEDFIQGLRPDAESETMKFRPVDGVFKMISDKAMSDEENNYVIIIDEINRGNISKIFGELITLIEDDKRWGEVNQLSVTLPSGQVFAVPNNLYIVGTMNSADKSISLIDTALRRRFFFIEKAPDYSTIENAILKSVLEKLNQYIKNELRSTDLLIGHAFFIGKTENELADIMNGQIIPLLYEYFYDDEARVKRALECLEGTSVKIDSEYQGRVRVK